MEEKDKDVLTDLGKEYTGVKGKDAIDLLMKEKQGYVKDAFTRKDIGDIALVWGDDNMGLQHIIKRRTETGQNLDKVLRNLTDVIEKGNLEPADKERLQLTLGNDRAIIDLKFRGNKLQFVLTAFELYKNKN